MFDIMTFILIGVLAFTQKETFEVKLYFYNDCTNSVEMLDYNLIKFDSGNEVLSSVNSKVSIKSEGLYLVSASIIEGNRENRVNDTIYLQPSPKTYIDTLFIPKIRFTVNKNLLDKDWSFFNCDKICTGKEVDYHANGNQRLSGIFKDGKPIEVTYYRENGRKRLKKNYKLGQINYRRIEFFDLEGNLERYEICTEKNSKIIIKVFDSEGMFLMKRIENNYH